MKILTAQIFRNTKSGKVTQNKRKFIACHDIDPSKTVSNDPMAPAERPRTNQMFSKSKNEPKSSLGFALSTDEGK